MSDVLNEIEIEISKSANGQDYVQIRSPATMPINIVLIANRITVNDRRKSEEATPKTKRQQSR